VESAYRGRVLAEVAALTDADRCADGIDVLTRALSDRLDDVLLRALISLEMRRGRELMAATVRGGAAARAH
jgi:hypothetical protein